MSMLVRTEQKFRVLPGRAEALHDLLRRQLGADALCEIRTAYFDTPTGALSRLALDHSPYRVTIRAREYEPLTGPRSPRSVWLEVKLRSGDQCTKSRRELDGASAAEILAQCRVSDLMLELGYATVLSEPRLQGLIAQEDGVGAYALGLVVCRRLSFEKAGVRVTLDRAITYHPPPPGLYREIRYMRDAMLPEPWLRERRAILELKTDDSAAAGMLAGIATPTEYSKFVILATERARRVGLRGDVC